MSNAKIDISFDVGYASIGWAVACHDDGNIRNPEFLGTGSVVFEADRCLASERRSFRRQRRHIRATRKRIERMKDFLISAGVLHETTTGTRHLHSEPWRLAVAVLRENRILTEEELWAVLLWYAHNRGYDGNRLWSSRLRADSNDSDKADDDTAKEFAAKKAMADFNVGSMAEAVLDIVTKGVPSGPALESYKSLNLAFPRKTVANEIQKILECQIGKLPGMTKEVVSALLADPVDNPDALRNIPGIPKAFLGGILMGQTKPRFDNRIPSICPVSGQKTPTKACDEFLAFRWAELLSHVRVGESFADMRPLAPAEIERLNSHARKYGRYTKQEFRRAVSEISGTRYNNTKALLDIPDAETGLTRYPGLAALDMSIGIDSFKDDIVTQNTLKKLSHAMFLGKLVTRETLIPLLKPGFDTSSMRNSYSAKIAQGRAPYSKDVMRKAVAEIYKGKDPRERDGILYRDATVEDPLPEEKIDQATNNHLVRHRIKILLRLLRDIVSDYAENNPARVNRVFMEVARDIKDFSGKKQKQIQSELNTIYKSHQEAVAKAAADLGVDPMAVGAGLARKIRIAKDLNFTCPYTGHVFDVSDIRERIVDLDHILPRSQRQSDSLDSLVLTYGAVNKLKSNRTALEFIRECGGQDTVEVVRANGERLNLQIRPEAQYLKFVESLRADKRATRQEARAALRRKQRLTTLHTAEETGMTEGMLTQTSAIAKLAARAISGWFKNRGCKIPPTCMVPGRITKEVRSQYKLLGMLAQFDIRLTREYVDFDGTTKRKVVPKGEMRNLTHMHHAVDAIAILLSGTVIDPDPVIWSLMGKRHLSDEERHQLSVRGSFEFDSRGNVLLAPLPLGTLTSIRNALGELRTVRYSSKRLGRSPMEQMQWRVDKVENGRVFIHQTINHVRKTDIVSETAAYGLHPKDGMGKLHSLQAIYIADTNYAVALGKDPEIVRERFVWKQLHDLAEKNNKKIPPLLRKGDLISLDNSVWMVRSIKDNKGKLLMDLTYPYVAESPANGVTYWKINVNIAAQLKSEKLKLLPSTLTGVKGCPITQLKSEAKNRRKSAAKTDSSSAE